MNPDTVAGLISATGVVISLAGSALIKWGTLKTRVDTLEKTIPFLATKEQLTQLKADVAEIKGMFRMTLRDGKD